MFELNGCLEHSYRAGLVQSLNKFLQDDSYGSPIVTWVGQRESLNIIKAPLSVTLLLLRFLSEESKRQGGAGAISVASLS